MFRRKFNSFSFQET